MPASTGCHGVPGLTWHQLLHHPAVETLTWSTLRTRRQEYRNSCDHRGRKDTPSHEEKRKKRTHLSLYIYSIHRMYCHDSMASCRCNVGHAISFWKTSTSIDSLESWTLSKPETAMQRMMLWFAHFLFTTQASESHRSVLRWRWEAIPGHPHSPRWRLRREDLALRKSTSKSKDSYVTMCNNEKLQNSQDIRDATLQ